MGTAVFRFAQNVFLVYRSYSKPFNYPDTRDSWLFSFSSTYTSELVTQPQIKKASHFRERLCAPGGNRTRTGVAAHRILSPACLPVPPPGRLFKDLKKNPSPKNGIFGAKDRARTGHPDLGKVVLYQMSYFRLYKNYF